MFFAPVCHSVHRGDRCLNMHHRSHDRQVSVHGGLCLGVSVQGGLGLGVSV